MKKDTELHFEESVFGGRSGEYGYLELPLSRTPFLLIGILGVLFAGVVLARLGFLTIVNGKAYEERSFSNIHREILVPAPRGKILDVSGVVLASEEPTFSVVLQLGDLFRSGDIPGIAEKLAETLKGKVPVIYSSATNKSIAYNWKIKFNETGKIPAFYNVVPELNHNEMTGFDAKESSAKLSENFHFIFLKDDSDHPQNLKRMEVMEKLYADRGFPVSVLELRGSSKIEKIFSSLVLADWAAYHTAEIYGLESEQVPMVEEFKKLVS